MQEQAYTFLISIFAFLSIVIGHIFDVPPATLWAAAVGSAFGVAFSREIHWFKAFCLILVGTISMGYAVPFVITAAPSLAQKSVAFMLAFILIGFRVQIRESSPRLIEAAFKAGEEAIGRFGAMFKKPGGDQ